MCMCVCVYVCMYVRMYVCMYVCICACVYVKSMKPFSRYSTWALVLPSTTHWEEPVIRILKLRNECHRAKSEKVLFKNPISGLLMRSWQRSAWMYVGWCKLLVSNLQDVWTLTIIKESRRNDRKYNAWVYNNYLIKPCFALYSWSSW